jgi:glycerophosphoryl diester phosphodiesterase
MSTHPAPPRLAAPPWVVAHRGASESLPENTLASIRRALEECADMIELDLQLTTDGQLVAVHDWTAEVDGRVRTIEESAFVELRSTEIAESDTFPRLEEILDLVPESVPLNLELKRRRADSGQWTECLSGGVAGRRNLLLSSFDWDLLETVHRTLPELAVAPIGSRQPHALLQAAERLGAWSVHCHRRLAFGDFIAAARASRWPVLVYTVNDVDLGRELIDRGVSGLFTDAPGRMLEALGRAAPDSEEK